MSMIFRSLVKKYRIMYMSIHKQHITMKKSTKFDNYLNLSPGKKAEVREHLKAAIEILGCDSREAWQNGSMEWPLWQAYQHVDCLDSVLPMIEAAQKEVQASTVREFHFPVDIWGNKTDEPYRFILDGPFDIQYECTTEGLGKPIMIKKIEEDDN